MSNIPHTLSSAIVPRSLYALEQSILGWAHERNLIKGSSCRKQLAKTCEEFGELAAGLNKNKRDLIKDGVGDVLVTLIIANGCAGGEYLFPTAGNPDWIQPPPHVRSKGYAELIIHTLQELSYIASVNDAGNWRPSLCYDLVRALSAAAEFASCSLAECLLTAWLEIKDRKGRMVDGVFVKEADLPPVVYGSGTVRSPEQEAPVPPDHNC